MNELYVKAGSALHALDARVKLILTLAFLIFLALTPPHRWTAYLLFYLLLLAAEICSRLSPVFFLKRSFVALPFILAAAPLIFTGPPPLISIPGPADMEFFVSLPGLERFAVLAVKSWISVQAAILLAATTRFTDLLAAMRAMKMPAIFVAILGLMGRYLAVIVVEAQSLLRARASRSADAAGRVKNGGSLAWRGQVAGGMAGSLFLRSIERGDRVYAAMLSRGYNGDLPTSSVPALRTRDLITLFFGFGILITVLGITHN